MPDKCQRAAASPPNSHRIIVGIEFLFFKIASKLSETNDQLIRGGKKKGCNCVGKGRVKSFLNIY